MSANSETEPAMPEPTPPTAAPPAPAAPPVAPPEKQPPWGKPENFDPDKAWELIQNLKEDRAKRSAANETLAKRLEEMEQTVIPRDRLAAALGIAPESMTEAEQVSKQIEDLRSQVLATERRALAAEHKIPQEFHHMLTATDSESLRKQAADLVSFAEAAHFAASAASPPATPAFQPHPGQGQGGGALTPEAQAAAEYEKFYPPTAK